MNERKENTKVLAGFDLTLRVAGKSFRCTCGCNVFRHPVNEHDVYVCNGCSAEYEAYDD